jgi:hypothetical protein
MIKLLSDVLKAHTNDITRLQWFEDKTLLLTSSKDKVIKVYISFIKLCARERRGVVDK